MAAPARARYGAACACARHGAGHRPHTQVSDAWHWPGRSSLKCDHCGGHSSPVVHKNSLLTPLDDLPSTCDNPYEGILLVVVEGHFGYDTTSTLAPYPIPDHQHAMDTPGR